MQLPSWIRFLASRALRLYPVEHGKYTILTKYFNRLFSATEPHVTVFRTSHNFVIEGDLGEFLQSWIYAFGSYELPTVRFIRSYLQRNNVAIDVGAQIGYLTLVMSTSASSTTQVYSFEPEERNIRRFRRNIQLNKLTNVTLLEQAAGQQRGSIRLYLSSDANAGTHSTVFIEGNVSDAFVDIPCTTIDFEVTERGLNRLDLLKIDVEGGEIDVIKGATDTLTRFHPVVITELSDSLQQARGTTCRDFKVTMAEFGYSPFTINNDGSLCPSEFDAAHPMDNVVFVAKDQRQRVRISPQSR